MPKQNKKFPIDNNVWWIGASELKPTDFKACGISKQLIRLNICIIHLKKDWNWSFLIIWKPHE